MVRALSLCCFGGCFLMISPSLRGILLGGLASAIGGLDTYSPWSYAACALGALVVVGVTLNQGSQPR